LGQQRFLDTGDPHLASALSDLAQVVNCNLKEASQHRFIQPESELLVE
jgi:hypothetical protein